MNRNSWNPEKKALVLYLTVELAIQFCSSSAPRVENEQLAVTTEDLEHLCQLVEVTDGGPTWIQVMDRSSPTMCYQAWRRDPEVPA